MCLDQAFRQLNRSAVSCRDCLIILSTLCRPKSVICGGPMTIRISRTQRLHSLTQRGPNKVVHSHCDIDCSVLNFHIGPGCLGERRGPHNDSRFWHLWQLLWWRPGCLNLVWFKFGLIKFCPLTICISRTHGLRNLTQPLWHDCSVLNFRIAPSTSQQLWAGLYCTWQDTNL